MAQLQGKKVSSPTKPLADVNVIARGNGSHEVVVCVMPDVDSIVGEGQSRAFIALDGSVSMKKMYGHGGGPFMVGDPNYVEAVSRKLGEILTTVTRTGTVSGIYWAVGADGSKTQPIGDFDEAGWSAAMIPGPKQGAWGRGTKLLPAIKHGVDQIAASADWTMGVIITDGIIEDEQESMDYCLKLGREIAAGKHKPVKLVLIGIGEEVDEDQLQRFDDMFEGTGIDYDLWSHGMVASMRDEADILGVLFGELANEETVVAPSGHVTDSTGRQLISWTDGVPGKFRFVLPKGETRFTLHVANRQVAQDVSEALNTP